MPQLDLALVGPALSTDVRAPDGGGRWSGCTQIVGTKAARRRWLGQQRRVDDGGGHDGGFHVDGGQDGGPT